MHLYYSTTVMFSLFSFFLDVGNDVYCILLPARPRASVIGALEQDQKFISVNFYPLSYCCARCARTELCKNSFRMTFVHVVKLSRCVIHPVNSKSRQIVGHCVI